MIEGCVDGDDWIERESADASHRQKHGPRSRASPLDVERAMLTYDDNLHTMRTKLLEEEDW